MGLFTFYKNSWFNNFWDLFNSFMGATYNKSVKEKGILVQKEQDKKMDQIQIDIAEKILQYPQQALQLRNKLLKRVSIDEFKKIPDSQIQLEYKVLNSADFYNEKQTLYLKKTPKNRYIDILVYNHSRVKCSSSQNFYCNASHMKSAVDGKDFAIFAQAPTPQGVPQFWEMIYQKNVKSIIMLCNFHDPRRGRQSEQYWPDLGKTAQIEHVGLLVENKKQQKLAQDFVITTFNVKGKEGQKSVQHIHWTGWSDLKKPLGNENEALFRNLVKWCLDAIEKNEMFLVHCSAGIGRTGTLGTVIDAIRCAKMNKQLSVFEIVQNLRRHRMSCVQTFEQYRFVYQELKRYFSD